MIDDMIALLGKEQADDDKQKGFCDDMIRKAGDEKGATEETIKAVSAKISELDEVIETADSEISALKAGIASLDTSVAEATDMRKKEHAEFSSSASANQAALELLDMAKNRMNKFYNPTMYKETTTTAAPLYGLVQEGDLGFVQVSLHSQLRTEDLDFGEYKKSQASGGIIQMLDQMIGDVEAEMAEAKRDEEDGQKEYEGTMADATAKRATDSKLIVTKEAAKAELVSKLDDAKSDKGDADTLLGGLVTKIADLHSTCDFLLENYDFRKDARGNEINGLHEGKAVLSSQWEGFLQKF
jgi:chromosome segregation ATPase